MKRKKSIKTPQESKSNDLSRTFLDSLRKENDVLRQSNDTLRNIIKTLQRDNDLLRKSNDALFQSNDLLNKRIDALPLSDEPSQSINDASQKNIQPLHQPDDLSKSINKPLQPVNDASNQENELQTRSRRLYNSFNPPSLDSRIHRRHLRETELLVKKGSASLTDFKNLLGISDATAKRDVALLKRFGILYFRGSRKQGVFLLSEKANSVLSQKEELPPAPQA